MNKTKETLLEIETERHLNAKALIEKIRDDLDFSRLDSSGHIWLESDFDSIMEQLHIMRGTFGNYNLESYAMNGTRLAAYYEFEAVTVYALFENAEYALSRISGDKCSIIEKIEPERRLLTVTCPLVP